MGRGFHGIFAAAIALLIAALPSAAAAGADLSQLLAAPPSSDWIESGPDPTSLVGPITATSYSAWVNDSGGSARALRRYGFVGGYGRVWGQRATGDTLSEWVLQFTSSAGATYWFNDLKLFDETSKNYKRDIPSIPDKQSVGVEDDFSDGSREYTIEFTKGNLFFDVTMDADTTDLTSATHHQAQTEYETAPAGGIGVPGQVQLPSGVLPWLGLGSAAILLMTAVVFALLVRATRRPRQLIAPAGVHVSPDGAYWWDGQHWRPMTNDPPPRPPRA